MDYEKAYKKALERARVWKEKSGMPKNKQSILDDIFPELKESEDEKIVDAIRKALESKIEDLGNGVTRTACLAWLEKQGDKDKLIKELGEYKVKYTQEVLSQQLEKQCEQKSVDKEYTFKAIPRLLDMMEPTEKAKAYCQKLIDTLKKEGYHTDAKIVGECLRQMNGENVAMAVMDEQPITDKVEPKFKIDDWVTCEELNTAKILNINNDRYEIEFIDGYKGFPHIDYVDRLFHLWSIKDAKDGDVLTSELCGTIMLYKGIRDNNVQFYCDYDLSDYYISGDRFAINNKQQHYGSVDDSDDWHPATKEQCDTFFKAMHEAGYEWDAENKAMTKIEQKGFALKEVIPRYSIGDVLCDKSCTTLSKKIVSLTNFEITDIRNGMYICDKGSFPISQQDEYELVAKRIE